MNESIEGKTVHANAFVQLDPRDAIVHCVCGAGLGPQEFAGLTTNHASFEACMRWDCPVCAYHPYAAMPIGESATYLPVFRSWLGEHADHNGEEIVVLEPTIRGSDGNRIYRVRFQDCTEHFLTAQSFCDPREYDKLVHRGEARARA